MKASIIVPVYNAASTLAHSLDSIKAQAFRDFEVVFIDDCSTDGTAEIVSDFAANSGIPCKIINQPHNSGVAAARNRGLAAAEGEYVAFVDADDTIAPDALEQAFSAFGGDSDPDIVGWDWTLGFEKNGRYMRQPECTTPLDALKALMGGTMRWNLWLFLVKRNLLDSNGLRFIDGANMGEDMMLMLKAFACAGSFVQIHKSLYNYNAVSSSSISRQFSEVRRAEVSRNIAEVEKAVRASGYAAVLNDYVQYLKLYIKLPLIISADKANYDIWSGWFPESNAFAAANRALPFRTRLVQWMASHKLWGGVRLYYLLVYKFVYGIIYR